MYQILFEHLIDGRIVSFGGLVRRYKKVNPDLGFGALSKMAKKINLAVGQSKDRVLRKKSFKRPKPGGATPVFSRMKVNSRFTPAQRKIIDRTIEKMHEEGKPSYVEMRIACLVELRRVGLGGNVVLSNLAISRTKKRLGLPLQPPYSSKRPKRRP